MPFVDCPQCKICKSKLRPKIDIMLSKGTPYIKIMAFAKKNGLDVNKSNISKHTIKHRSLTKGEIEEKTKHHKTRYAARKNYNKEALQVISASQCLDDIINRAYTRMQKGEVLPTLDNALKAIELKTKLNEAGVIESTLLTFMLEFAHEQPALPKPIIEKHIPFKPIVEQPEGVFSALEEISGAKIRAGSDATYMASMNCDAAGPAPSTIKHTITEPVLTNQ